MVTKSDNTKGNPYHDKEGKFTKKRVRLPAVE